MTASAGGNVKVLRALLATELVRALNDRDDLGQTALHFALLGRVNPPLVVELLRKGANPAIQDDEGHSAFDQLCSEGQWDVVMEIARLSPTQPSCTAHAAAAIGTPEEFSKATVGIDIDATGPGGRTPLWLAASKGRPEIVRSLLAAGADPNRSDDTGKAPLAAAVENGHVGLVGTLLEAGADVATVDSEGTTALHLACRVGSESSVRALLAAGANPNVLDKRGHTPLLAYCIHRGISDRGLEEAVPRMLIAAGADPNIPEREHNRTPLLAVLERHDRFVGDIAGMLLRAGAEPEHTDSDGDSALSLACANDHLAIARQIVASGFPVQGRASALVSCVSAPEVLKVLLKEPLSTALATDVIFHAVLKCKKESIKLLIDAGASVTVRPRGNPLTFTATALCSTDIVSFLLSQGVSVEGVDQNGENTLHIAFDNPGHTAELLPVLIRAGALVNLPNQYGQTPLHYAVRAGEPALVAMLLAAGANKEASDEDGATPFFYLLRTEVPWDGDGTNRLLTLARALKMQGLTIDAVDHEGRTPLMAAAAKGHAPAAHVLLEIGANVNTGSELATSPLWSALTASGKAMSLAPEELLDEGERAVLIKLLLEAGADPNVRNATGDTPLMRAAFQGDAVISKLLLAGRAEVDAQNEFGWSALMFAASQGHIEVIETLLRKRATKGLRNSFGETACSIAKGGPLSPEVSRVLCGR